MNDEPEEDSDNYDNDEELRELVEKALKQSLVEKKTFKRRQDLAQRLCTIISEYLDCYILLGYDFQGRHLDIKASKTPQQVEALNSFLLKYFASEMNHIKGYNNGMGGPDEIL
jgi:hypothetical protein|tara:strand:- start:42 stop:380 length:339 start_codon:yes stop_codon:yes gene_type:complete